MNSCCFISQTNGIRCKSNARSENDKYCVKHIRYTNVRRENGKRVISVGPPITSSKIIYGAISLIEDDKPMIEDAVSSSYNNRYDYLTISETVKLMTNVFKNRQDFPSDMAYVCYEAIERSGRYINRDQWTSILSAHSYLCRTPPRHYCEREWNIIWKGH